jgi:hypothetical protein
MNMQEEGDIHRLPCYQGLSEESIDHLEVRVGNIRKISNKASFDIAIELCGARDEYRHNKHGGFEGWVEERLKIGRSTAYRIIDRYNGFATVPNLGQLDIVLSAQYQLSAPTAPKEAREEALELAESGEKITVAKANELIEKWQRIAEDNKKKADDAKAQIDIFQSHSKLADDKIDELSQQITELEEKLKTAQTPEKVEVIPQTTLNKIDNLESLVTKLKDRNQRLSDERTKLTTELRAQRDANEERRKQEQYEYKIKDGWKKSTEVLYKALSQFVGSIPSPIAIQVFEGDEWARYDQIEQALKHFYEAFSNIKNTRYSDQFVESAVVNTSMVVEG